MTMLEQAFALESGSPSDNSDAFRRALGHFATGVTIITAEAKGLKVGITANSFNSVSLDPPLVLWSVKKSSTSWPVFAAANSFAINVLAQDQSELATQFARSGTDKYKDVAWKPGKTGAPLLSNVTTQFECLRRVEHEGGDHFIVVGEVKYFARYDRRPLVFIQGRFSAAIDNADTEQPNSSSLSAVQPTFLALFRRAFLQRSSELREEARGVGFTVNESRLIYHLAIRPRSTLKDLARVSLLEMEAAKDGIEAMVSRGWIAFSPDSTLDMTELGQAQFGRLQEAASKGENGKLNRFSDAEINTARNVIASFGGHLDNIPAFGEAS